MVGRVSLSNIAIYTNNFQYNYKATSDLTPSCHCWSNIPTMRAEPIYPHKFGRGIPNPVGPATFRGLQHAGRVQKMPDNWGPLVSNRLDYSTSTASFSQHQLRDISKYQALYEALNEALYISSHLLTSSFFRGGHPGHP